MWKLALSVFIGSGLGGVCRWGVGLLLPRLVTGNHQWPLATFAVNLAGCFLIGLFYGLGENGLEMSPEMRLLLTTGFCGGLTTFSTFSNETFQLLEQGAVATAMCYAAGSLILGVLAAWAGHSLATFS